MYMFYSATQTILIQYKYCIHYGTFWIVRSAVTSSKHNTDGKRGYVTFESRNNTIFYKKEKWMQKQ